MMKRERLAGLPDIIEINRESCEFARFHTSGGKTPYIRNFLYSGMSDTVKPFEKMVSTLVDTYGMSREGAEKLVVQSAESVYTANELSKYKNMVEKLKDTKSHEEARVEACKFVINSNPTWSMTAEDAHKYQLSGGALM